ncbi:MAG: retropepsin-like aspartic protease [Flavobacteriales bacterium]|nr:retropepsin-like aspartic protease [Flavobacteriales bacterium]
MSILKIPIRYEGAFGEETLLSLFDSGSSYSLMHRMPAEKLETLGVLRKPLELSMASENSYLKVNNWVRLDFYYNDIRMSDEFLVVSNLSEDVIIGTNTLQKWRIKVDLNMTR